MRAVSTKDQDPNSLEAGSLLAFTVQPRLMSSRVPCTFLKSINELAGTLADKGPEPEHRITIPIILQSRT